MAEYSGTEPELLDCAVRYLASLGTTPEELRRRYPHTYQTFAELSCAEIEVLDRIGASLALDDPKGDNHKDGEDADDATRDSGDKLKKYLYVIHYERKARVCGTFSLVERTWIEPVTSGLQSRRSPS